MIITTMTLASHPSIITNPLEFLFTNIFNQKLQHAEFRVDLRRFFKIYMLHSTSLAYHKQLHKFHIHPWVRNSLE